jgi:protein-disulfide isomerase
MVLISFGILAAWYTNQEKEEIVHQAQTRLYRVDAMELGDNQARVKVVEFFDPECESCRFFHPYVKMLVEEFGDRVHFSFRYAPFHGNSKLIIKILEAARKQEKYWEVLDTLYQYQPQWGDHHHPRPELVWGYLENVVNLDQLQQDMKDPHYEEIIAQDMADGQLLGVRMTPSFFVNGDPLMRFSYDALKEMIERSLQAD